MPTTKEIVVQGHPNLIPQELHKFHKGSDERPFLTDVDIVCNGGYIPVHSSILMAGSPLFRNLFMQERGSQSEPMTIHLVDYAIADVTLVVVCFYTGVCVASSRAQVQTLYEIFEQFGVNLDGLTFSTATADDIKGKNYIRRYLDCDDDDMLIEEGEEIPIDDDDDQLAPGGDDGNKESEMVVVPTTSPAVEVSVPNINTRNEETESRKKKHPDRLIKCHPSLIPKAVKVVRDGVSGVKEPQDDSDTDDSEESGVSETEQQNSSRLDSSLTDKSANERVHSSKRKADSEEPPQPTHSKKPKESVTSSSKKDEDFEAKEDSSEDDDEPEDEEEIVDSDEISNFSEETSGSGETRDDRKVWLKTRGRKKNLRSRKSESPSSPIIHKLRRRRNKRPKYVIDDDDDDDDGNDVPKGDGGVGDDAESAEPATENDQVPQTATSTQEIRVEKDASECDIDRESCRSSVDFTENYVDDGEEDIEESERCMLKEISIRVERLTEEEIQRHIRGHSSRASESRSLLSATSSDPHDTHQEEEEESLSVKRSKIRSRRGSRSSSSVSQTSVKTRRTLSRESPAIRNSAEPSSSSTENCLDPESVRFSISVLQVPDTDSNAVNVADQDFEDLRSKILRWKNTVTQCGLCHTPHNDISEATKCLKRRKSYRCWYCLGVFRESTIKFADHYKSTHLLKSTNNAPCPICGAGCVSTGIQSHIKSHFLHEELGSSSRGTEQQAQNEALAESEDESPLPFVRIKSPTQLFESDNDDDDDAEELPLQSPGQQHSSDLTGREGASRNVVSANVLDTTVAGVVNPNQQMYQNTTVTHTESSTRQMHQTREPEMRRVGTPGPSDLSSVSAVVIAHGNSGNEPGRSTSSSSHRNSSNAAGSSTSSCEGRSNSPGPPILSPQVPLNERLEGTLALSQTFLQSRANSMRGSYPEPTSSQVNIPSQLAMSRVETSTSSNMNPENIAHLIKDRLHRRFERSQQANAQLPTPIQASSDPNRSAPIPSTFQSHMYQHPPHLSANGNESMNPAKTVTTTCVHGSTTVLLSSRNVPHRPLPSPSEVANPDSALIVFRPPDGAQTPDERVTNSVQTIVQQTTAAVPASGSTTTPAQYCGVTSIGGVPFKIFSRPSATAPHPQAVVTVSEDCNSPNRYVIRSPHSSFRPGLTYQASSFAENSLKAIQRFQASLNESEVQEAVSGEYSLSNFEGQPVQGTIAVQGHRVNQSHQVYPAQRQMIQMQQGVQQSYQFIPTQQGADPRAIMSQQHPLVDVQSRLIIEHVSTSQTEATLEQVNGALFRCDKCEQQFGCQSSLNSHLCFED